MAARAYNMVVYAETPVRRRHWVAVTQRKIVLGILFQGLKGFGVSHPDSKRTHRAKVEARMRSQRRRFIGDQR